MLYKILTALIIVCSTFNYGLSKELVNIEIKDSHVVKISEGFTAFSIEGLAEYSSLKATVNGEKFDFSKNPHFNDNSVSNLILFDKVQYEILFTNSSKAVIKFELNHYNASYKTSLYHKIKLLKATQKRNNCDQPPYIDQDVWREGLPTPKPNPSTTQVSHLIIHHSATTNSVSDYTLAVRNIYLYHTNTNGWDDVGYNYLLTPDGTLYAGRDGQGKEDDNIKGAHFCGKNSYTMGICLIGNYSEVSPTDSMLYKLEALLAWKANKDNLQPLEKSFHPKGSSTGFNLANICGHRDGFKAGVFSGCQTECPGDFTYTALDSIRINVGKRLIDCGFTVGKEEPKEPISAFLFNGILSFSSKDIASYRITHISGKLITTVSGHEKQTSLPKGVFIINIIDQFGSVSTQKMVNL